MKSSLSSLSNSHTTTPFIPVQKEPNQIPLFFAAPKSSFSHGDSRPNTEMLNINFFYEGNITNISLTQFTVFIMKFLESTALDSINLFLSHLNLGESTIKGSLEAFSCKHTGTDRKLSMSLEHEILDYLGQSADSDPPSPVDYLSSRSSRKTLIYLVLTLSHMYPDYDFSPVRTHLFFKEEEWNTFELMFETYLFEAAKEWAVVNGGSSLLETMSKAIDEVVKLGDCEVYSYNPDFDGDPFLEKGAIWSFNFFFYNRKLKRIVSFRCCCLSNLAGDGFIGNEAFVDDEEDDLLVDMEM